MRRRAFLAGAAMLPLVGAPRVLLADDAPPFSRSVVLERARALAAEAFAWPDAPPAAIARLTAEQYAMIGFREEQRLFVDPPTGFAVDLLHPGFIYSIPVEIFLVEGGASRKIEYDPALFNFGDVPPPEPGMNLEFAGFRALTALNQPDLLQAFAIFAGASYFKAVSKGQAFGLSARGLAIGTGEAEGEEFPFFRAHWLETPGEGRMVVHSLLDGPSAAGAYRFTIRPGDPTQIDVEATIFARENIAHLGLAPLTSMFLFDAKDRGEHDDFRLGVHDSDGLAMWNAQDERIWRPLHSPRLLQISAFADSGPRGFGLVQRERSFSDYEDLGAAYHRRPSAWVEPIGDWGKGHVVLVEIPSGAEIHDNIVAYWRPEEDIAKGNEISLTYRLSWGWDAPDLAGLLRVERTLSGAGRNGRRRFVVDFAGDAPNPIRASAVQLVAQANPGSLHDVEIAENPEINGLRISADLDPEGADSVEMRLELRSGDRRIAETWIYRWSS
ncbi:glucan biosynthesis protein [Amaricoccus sp.]|uniref:glucan biosynthesis protein n=1 Tax=Amaricoccus sp. TaxID=1872485 RepID=UPI0026021956|nr:glucan biosynthesis protein G [Amaricoccus sp.]HRO09885.1 glucan biosynthesis protein G [Amaricoccus sp.]